MHFSVKHAVIIAIAGLLSLGLSTGYVNGDDVQESTIRHKGEAATKLARKRIVDFFERQTSLPGEFAYSFEDSILVHYRDQKRHASTSSRGEIIIVPSVPKIRLARQIEPSENDDPNAKPKGGVCIYTPTKKCARTLDARISTTNGTFSALQRAANFQDYRRAALTSAMSMVNRGDLFNSKPGFYSSLSAFQVDINADKSETCYFAFKDELGLTNFLILEFNAEHLPTLCSLRMIPQDLDPEVNLADCMAKTPLFSTVCDWGEKPSISPTSIEATYTSKSYFIQYSYFASLIEIDESAAKIIENAFDDNTIYEMFLLGNSGS